MSNHQGRFWLETGGALLRICRLSKSAGAPALKIRYTQAMIGQSALIKVRSVKSTDSDALASLFRDSWRHAYLGIIPALHLDRMIRRRDHAWWCKSIASDDHMLVVEAAGVVAGYASCGKARKGGRYQGEIYELYIAPVYQGIGLGEHLFEACRHHLDVRGLAGLIVWALADNDGAANFYWRRGGRPVGETQERSGDTSLTKIAFGWP